MIRILIIAIILLLQGCFYLRTPNFDINCVKIFAFLEGIETDDTGTEITMVDSWYFHGKTDEERMKQWIECGGDSRGFYEEYRSSLSFKEQRNIKYKQQICMMDMGYYYIGSSCVERNEYPSCREMNLDKFPPRSRERIWESREKWEAREELLRRQRIRPQSQEK